MRGTYLYLSIIIIYSDFKDHFFSGRESLGYSDEEDVYAVLEEDGTEVDEEEYFMMLEHR